MKMFVLFVLKVVTLFEVTFVSYTFELSYNIMKGTEYFVINNCYFNQGCPTNHQSRLIIEPWMSTHNQSPTDWDFRSESKCSRP